MSDEGNRATEVKESVILESRAEESKDESGAKAVDSQGSDETEEKKRKVEEGAEKPTQTVDTTVSPDEPKEDSEDAVAVGSEATETPELMSIVDDEDAEAHMKEKTDSESSLNALVIDEGESVEESAKAESMDDDAGEKESTGEVAEGAAKKGNTEEIAKEMEEEDDDDNVKIIEKPITVIEIDDEEEDDKKTPQEKQTKEDATDAQKPTEDLISSTKETPAIPETDDDTEMKDNDNGADATQPMEIVEGGDVKEDATPKIHTAPDVFHNKECINYECPKRHTTFYRAPQFLLSYFKVNNKKAKAMYVCEDCFDEGTAKYNELANTLLRQQPLFSTDAKTERPECVEIVDSSDEDSQEDAADRLPAFRPQDIELIASELDNCMAQVFQKIDIQTQLTWSKKILDSRLAAVVQGVEANDAELRALKEETERITANLYNTAKLNTRHLEPWDANYNRPYQPTKSDCLLPPAGEVQRPAIQLNNKYYAVKNKVIASWMPCVVVDTFDGALGPQKDLKHYKISFLKSQYQTFRMVSAKHMAYYDPPPVRLSIGDRVIAYFDASSLTCEREKMMIQSAFYPGIIAEPLKPTNKYRYLIFYDDGYTQYVYHKDVRLVCHVAQCVWDDVHPASRDFIRKYITEYSTNRPMVQTQRGQIMKCETNGKWLMAKVLEIDSSLIKMQFEGPGQHTEWIYRGSMRLGPVFREYQRTAEKNGTQMSRLTFRSEPFVRYTADEEVSREQQQQEKARRSEPRAVAKKSTARPGAAPFENGRQTVQPTAATTAAAAAAASAAAQVRHLNNSTIYLDHESEPKGKVVYYTAKRNLPPMQYAPHLCSPTCLYKITHNLSAYSPLSKPLLSGWERLIITQKIKKVISYRAPCGKMLRNMRELRDYLRLTDNVLNVDNFDFSPETTCLAEYVIDGAIVHKRDISEGQEKMPLPLVNYYDNTMPPTCKYSAKVIPTEGVHINTDEEFLVGCDCEDDCSDKDKCACWQLTLAGAKYDNTNKNVPTDEIGYQYKRLYHPVLTGIYECNSRCKCKQNCLNRVVQHSLGMKLQVFKTSNRGWGLRCINDVPRGSFICIYAGHLLTEAKANEDGMQAGDEYLAELDYIEVAEQMKDGYESDVDLGDLEDDASAEKDDDDEFRPSKSFLKRSGNKSRQTRGSTQDEEPQERQVINFNPETNDIDDDDPRESTTRKLFGKDEHIYVMDAKITGNLGRYFNHSCAPNLFVQNVFVDTHDLRFPWVAFFASQHIRAGAELTWNYNYEVGVVPGKVLYCECGAPNCRLRLL